MTIVEDPPAVTRAIQPRTEAASVPTALARHWTLVVVAVLVGVAAGVAYAMSIPQTFTSEARLTVGQYDASSPGGLAGFADATRSLASSYSQSVSSEPVLLPVARKLGLSFPVVLSRVSASPVPQSPVIRLTAHGPTVRSAVSLANLSSDSLVDYADRLNRDTGRTDKLLAEIRRAIGRQNGFSGDLRAARKRYGGDDSAKNQRRVDRAKTRVDVERLRVESLQQSYQQSIVTNTGASLVQVLTRPQGASSDLRSRLQLYGLVGLIGGLLLGAAIATLRLNAARRRAEEVRSHEE